jgi:hypothetical protein
VVVTGAGGEIAQQAVEAVDRAPLAVSLLERLRSAAGEDCAGATIETRSRAAPAKAAVHPMWRKTVGATA